MPLKLTKKEFVKKAKEKHKGLFTYKNFEYKGMHQKSIITCKKHGDFETTPHNHLKRNCSKCNIENKSNLFKSNIEEFINKSNKLHFLKYDYSKFKYINAKTSSIIICNTHGEFKQTPQIHLRGCGCPKCGIGNISKPEIEVQNFIKTIIENIVTNTRKIIKPYELDIYLPSLKKAIEFNGEWWHYDERNPKCRGEKYHIMKTEMCMKMGIELLHVRESEWKFEKNKTKNKIENFLNINNNK